MVKFQTNAPPSLEELAPVIRDRQCMARRSNSLSFRYQASKVTLPCVLAIANRLLGMGWIASGVFCWVALLVLFFHVRIAHDSFSKVMDFCGSWWRTPDRKDVRVEERLRKIQLKNYKLICKGMCHFILPSVLCALREVVLMPGLSNVGTCCAVLVAYFHNLFVGADMVTVTPRRMKIACYILHVFTLLLAVCTSLDSTDLMAFSYNKSYMATTRLILLGFVDKSVTIPFNVLHAVVDIGMYFILFDDATVWTSLPSICISEMSFTLASISLSYALDIWVRSWIESLLETADAESLVSSFRRMLRGISDGEVLLDSDYKICGEGQCLQQLCVGFSHCFFLFTSSRCTELGLKHKQQRPQNSCFLGSVRTHAFIV